MERACNINTLLISRFKRRDKSQTAKFFMEIDEEKVKCVIKPKPKKRHFCKENYILSKVNVKNINILIFIKIVMLT